MPTGQVIVNNSLTALGILEQGGTPSGSDSNDTLTELNVQWDAWGIDEGLIYSIASAQGSLSADVASYTIGVGAAFNTPRPSRICKAVIAVTVGPSSIRREIAIVNAQKYYAHGDLAASGAMPDEMYPDYNVDGNGFAKLYFFPVPTCPAPTKIELETGVPFTAWALGVNTMLPQGYQDAIEKALAYRLIPRFGTIVDPKVAETVTELGIKAEKRLREMNAFNRQLNPMAAGLEAPAPTPQQ